MRFCRVVLAPAAASALAVASVAPSTRAQQFDTVEIRTVKVTEGVYMLMGAGGNLGVSTGEEGVFIVDDQYAPLTEKIIAAIAAVTTAPIRFVLNTHWHPDHTGGNENFGEAGALIVAHENVRKRMSVEQFIEAFGTRYPPSPEGALPVITFTEAVTFHWNGDEIHAFHVERAHTDGDAIIHFRKANVVHMGDVYFNGMYPFIDVSSDGSVDGMITAADTVLVLADERTKIIPGHGPLSDRTSLRAYRDMLATVRDRIQRALAARKTLEEIKAEKPTAEFDARWGKRFLSPDRFVEILYADLSRR